MGSVAIFAHAADCYSSFYELPPSVVTQQVPTPGGSTTFRLSLLYSNTCASNIGRLEESGDHAGFDGGFVHLVRQASGGLPNDEVVQQVSPRVSVLTDTPGLVSPHSLTQACYHSGDALTPSFCTPLL